MFEKINVENGNQVIVVENGIKNFEELESKFKEQAIKIEETFIDEDNYREVEKELKELIKPASQIRKVAAKFKKEGLAKVNVTYEKMKELENIIREPNKRKTEEVQEFKEARKQRLIETKKEATNELLEEMNVNISKMEAHLKTFEFIEFNEEKWWNLSIENIKKEMHKIYAETARVHKDCISRLKLADMKSKELKSDYGLETDIDYLSVLGAEIYELELDEVEAKLESKAEELQIQQEEFRAKIEEQARIKAEKEAREREEKFLREQKEREAKLEAERKAAEEKIRREEDKRKAQEDKLRAEQEAREREIRIEEQKKREQEQARIREEERLKLEEENRIRAEEQARIKAEKESSGKIKNFKIRVDCVLNAETFEEIQYEVSEYLTKRFNTNKIQIKKMGV